MSEKLSPDHILLLGDPKLYSTCDPVTMSELPEVLEVSKIMHQAILGFRQKQGRGRAIAAPQLGYMKRVIYAFPEDPMLIINPVLDQLSDEMIELWDDCMSFPTLSVRVQRHRFCRLTYLDENWTQQSRDLVDDLSELIQHENDHLDGILAIQRAIDDRSFRWITPLT